MLKGDRLTRAFLLSDVESEAPLSRLENPGLAGFRLVILPRESVEDAWRCDAASLRTALGVALEQSSLL
jgi:hypothetical protein